MRLFNTHSQLILAHTIHTQFTHNSQTMSRKDFGQQFPSHRDFGQQFPIHHDFGQQFPSEHDFGQQFPTEPINTPPEAIFPVYQQQPEAQFPINNNNPPTAPQDQPNAPQNQPTPLTEEEQYHQDMQELLHVEAEEEEERRARAAYWAGKRARRNARCAYRIAHGLPRVNTSDDDSSASSAEGWVSDDSFY